MSLLNKLQALGKAIKESGETGLFSILSNRSLTEVFKANPAHYFLFPFVALGMTINWVIETINYVRSRNKSWFNTGSLILLTIVTGLALTAILGTVILGEFVLGPFLFVGALSIGIALQIGHFFKNLFHALRSPKGSSQRMGYFQEMGKNAFTAILMAVTLGLVIAAMISPAGPAILAAIGVTAAVLTAASLAWHFMPKTWKQKIKTVFGKKSYEGKSELVELQELSQVQTAESEAMKTSKQPLLRQSNVSDFNLFKQEQRKFEIVKVAQRSPNEARQMLIKSIKSHIQRLSAYSPHHTVHGELVQGYIIDGKLYESQSAYAREAKPLTKIAISKQGQKIEVLKELLRALNSMVKFGDGLDTNETLKSIEQLHREHPKAFQSFFSSTSNTESLYDSVKFFIDNYSESLQSEVNPPQDVAIVTTANA